MKWLVYILLLVNLGIFLWHFQAPGTREVNKEQIDEQIPKLVLLKEFETGKNEAPQKQEKEEASNICYSLGPFLRKKTFQKVAGKFKDAKIAIRSRVSKDAIQDGYWVYLPPARSRAEAQQAMKRLQNKGVREFFLVVAGEKTNSISLGVFSKPNLAQRQLKRIQALGFEVRIDKLSLPKRAYWIEWPKETESQPPEALMVSIYEKYSGVGRTERPCPKNEK